jgi:hypothetical protein
MVFTNHVAHYTRTFPKGAIGRKAQLVHGVENAPMNGFKTVSRIGERPPYDYAHGVFQV